MDVCTPSGMKACKFDRTEGWGLELFPHLDAPFSAMDHTITLLAEDSCVLPLHNGGRSSANASC